MHWSRSPRSSVPCPLRHTTCGFMRWAHFSHRNNRRFLCGWCKSRDTGAQQKKKGGGGNRKLAVQEFEWCEGASENETSCLPGGICIRARGAVMGTKGLALTLDPKAQLPEMGLHRSWPCLYHPPRGRCQSALHNRGTQIHSCFPPLPGWGDPLACRR